MEISQKSSEILLGGMQGQDKKWSRFRIPGPCGVMSCERPCGTIRTRTEFDSAGRGREESQYIETGCRLSGVVRTADHYRAALKLRSIIPDATVSWDLNYWALVVRQH